MEEVGSVENVKKVHVGGWWSGEKLRLSILSIKSCAFKKLRPNFVGVEGAVR